MVKPFYLASSLLLLIIISIGVHYEDVTGGINTVVGITRITSPSLSVAYYERRIQRYDKANNIAYPEMISLNRMDFVYAK